MRFHQAKRHLWGTALLAAALYAYGYPAFDPIRPAALDRPFQAFHNETNHVVRETYLLIAMLPETRAARVVRSYVQRVQGHLSSVNSPEPATVRPEQAPPNP